MSQILVPNYAGFRGWPDSCTGTKLEVLGVRQCNGIIQAGPQSTPIAMVTKFLHVASKGWRPSRWTFPCFLVNWETQTTHLLTKPTKTPARHFWHVEPQLWGLFDRRCWTCLNPPLGMESSANGFSHGLEFLANSPILINLWSLTGPYRIRAGHSVGLVCCFLFINMLCTLHYLVGYLCQWKAYWTIVAMVTCCNLLKCWCYYRCFRPVCRHKSYRE